MDKEAATTVSLGPVVRRNRGTRTAPSTTAGPARVRWRLEVDLVRRQFIRWNIFYFFCVTYLGGAALNVVL